MTRRRPATIRYYFDADIQGLGKIVVQMRDDSTYCGDPGGELHKRARPPCPIARHSTLDEDWIPFVAEQGWLAITRDSAIQENLLLMQLVREHRCRMIALAGKDATNNWSQMTLLARVWPHIERLAEEPGPFVYAAGAHSFRSVTLEG